MWSTIEQSIGIICACLLTYQPLFRRMFSKSAGSSANAYVQRKSSKVIGMNNLSLKSHSKASGDASNAGFSRLDEESGIGSSVTTHVTAERPATLTATKDGIVRGQVFEQHHEFIS